MFTSIDDPAKARVGSSPSIFIEALIRFPLGVLQVKSLEDLLSM